MIKNKKLNKRTNILLGNIARLGDKAIAYVIAVFATPRNVQEDMTDPEKFKEPVFHRYKLHFKRHIHEQNKHRLQNWVCETGEKQQQPTDNDLLQEITDLGLGNVILSEKNAYTVHDVYYFEPSEHQPLLPMVCKYGDYKIKFSSAGMGWCGGTTREPGFVYKRNPNGSYDKIATITPDLSDYLAKIVDEQVKMQKAEREQIR